jgi:uncharacterized protein YegL
MFPDATSSAFGPRLPDNESRQPRVRAALFAAAVAASLALHALLLAELPHMPGLGGLRAPPPRPTRQAIALREVRTAPDGPAYADAPAAFRPEDPNAFATAAARQDDLLKSLRAEAEAASAGAFNPAPPSEAPAPLPDAADDTFDDADYRQEILQIEHIQAARELEALPRAVAPALPRVSGAPDITLPSDADSIAAAAAAAAAGTGGHGGSGRGSLSVPLLDETELEPKPASILADILAGAEAPPDPAPADRRAHTPSEAADPDVIPAPADLLDETTADVTDVAPLEQALEVAVTTFRSGDEDAVYFEAEIQRGGVSQLPVIPKDVLLVQDCSESITRTKLDFFKEGIVAYLRTLTTADRVNIMRYSDEPTLCFPGWQPVTAESLARAVDFTESMRARGATDLFRPLQQILKLPRDPARPMIVVLMTDGRPTAGTVDSSEIIAQFSKLNDGNVSVFTVGAGDRVNRFLLDLLAHDNRGGAWIQPLREEIPSMVARAGKELSRPVLTGLDYRFTGDSSAEVYPPRLTHLYLDRPLRLVGRCPATQKTAVLRILGDSGGRKKDIVFGLDLEGAESGGEGIRREWVMQKIYRLINDHLLTGRAETLREIRDLSIRHNLPLLYGEDFPIALP